MQLLMHIAIVIVAAIWIGSGLYLLSLIADYKPWLLTTKNSTIPKVVFFIWAGIFMLIVAIFA